MPNLRYCRPMPRYYKARMKGFTRILEVAVYSLLVGKPIPSTKRGMGILVKQIQDATYTTFKVCSNPTYPYTVTPGQVSVPPDMAARVSVPMWVTCQCGGQPDCTLCSTLRGGAH